MRDHRDLSQLEVPKKGHGKKRRDDVASTNSNALDKKFPSKIRSMCLGTEHDPRRLKNRGIIPLLRGCSVQSKALHTGAKIPTERKGYGTGIQLIWSLSHSRALSKSPKKMICLTMRTKKESLSFPRKHLLNLSGEGKTSKRSFKWSTLVRMGNHVSPSSTEICSPKKKKHTSSS